MLPSLGASFSYDSGAAMKLRLDRVEKAPEHPRHIFGPVALEQFAAIPGAPGASTRWSDTGEVLSSSDVGLRRALRC